MTLTIRSIDRICSEFYTPHLACGLLQKGAKQLHPRLRMTHLQVSRAEVADDCLILIRVPALRLQQHICLVQRSLVWLVIARVCIFLCRSLLLDLQMNPFSACAYSLTCATAMRFQQHFCLIQSSLVRLRMFTYSFAAASSWNLHMTYNQAVPLAHSATCMHMWLALLSSGIQLVRRIVTAFEQDEDHHTMRP